MKTQLLIQVVAGLVVLGLAALFVALVALAFGNSEGPEPPEILTSSNDFLPVENDSQPDIRGTDQNEDMADAQPPPAPQQSPLAAECRNAEALLSLAQQYLDSHLSPCVSQREVLRLPSPVCSDRNSQFELRADYSVTGQIFDDTSIVRICYRGRGEFDPAQLRYRLISGNLRELCALRGASAAFLGEGCR